VFLPTFAGSAGTSDKQPLIGMAPAVILNMAPAVILTVALLVSLKRWGSVFILPGALALALAFYSLLAVQLESQLAKSAILEVLS